MANVTVEKSKASLTLGDRIAIIKSKSFFSFAFSLTIFCLIIVFFGLMTDGRFFKKSVLLGIFNQGLIIGTMATAVSFIYTTGNLDISVGNVMAMAALVGAMLYQATENVILMLSSAIVVGILLMLLHSFLSVVLNISCITVAMVATQLYSAIISNILGPDTLSIDYGLCKALEGEGYRYIAFIGYFVVCYFIYHHTALGRELRFIGGNEECARQTGINSQKAVIVSFLMAGIGVGLAATFTIIRSGNISPSTGGGMGMDVMLATVLGGMSIFGGSKSNTYSGIIGALTVSALDKGMLMIGISSTMIQGVRGIIFLILVFLNSERLNTLPARQQF